MHDFNSLKEMFLQYLQENKMNDEPGGLYAPMNYMMELGGKRIRPVSLLIAYNIFKEDVEKALPLAYAIELFHNFTLAHDDVMDDALLRRGKPAMHETFGLNSAILSGDALLIYAYHYVLKSIDDLPLKNELLQLITQTAIDVCAGQQMDMDFETIEEVELSSYLLMIKLKTAVLIGASLKSGALLAGATADEASHLYLYGLNIGLAFQIQDDLLDLYAEHDGFGKKQGGDIIQKKKTFLFLKALELADDKQKLALKAIYDDSIENRPDKVLAVKKIFDKLKIKNHVELLMNELTENAKDHLDALKMDKNRLIVIEELGKSLLHRKN